MRQTALDNIKHFVLLCPHTLSAEALETNLESITYPLRFEQPRGRCVLMALPRRSGFSTPEQFVPMICGDSQDLNNEESMFLGNAIHIRQDEQGSFQIASSLTGLPALFIYRDSRCSIIADSIESIAAMPSSTLHFDLQSVLELAKIGAPINHRTLFREIEIIPAGSLVSITGDEITIKQNDWQPSSQQEFSGLESYVAYMADAMQAAISRMDLDGAFLALTAGLDTRAVLATLAESNKLIPAFTISGEYLTLDAMRAGQLCSSYNIDHHIVAINNARAEKLPEYTALASRYSGGLNSIEQATELYFYELAGAQFNARLSGNLGNQIGRSGTEGTGIRNAPVHSLSSEVVAGSGDLDADHWFFQVNEQSDLLAPTFLIQRENLFAQLGNYSIGHEMASQHTPYADRTLIDAKYREPLATRDKPKSIKDIKMRDLKHRILGQSPQRSFQCYAVQKAGGAVSSCPINWGWTTKGGFSAGGLYYGAKAFTDIVTGNKLNRIPGANKLLKKMGIKGFSSFHTRHILYSDQMQSYIKEIFLDQSVRQSGLFKASRLDYLIDNGFSDGQSDYDEIVLSLDLALATKNFGGSV